jgi:hypothetical protein
VTTEERLANDNNLTDKTLTTGRCLKIWPLEVGVNPHQWFMAWVRGQQLELLGHPYMCLQERICKLFSHC